VYSAVEYRNDDTLSGSRRERWIVEGQSHCRRLLRRL
jgi:hypothetical protein